MEEFGLIGILLALISLVVLIVFFVTAYNVGVIAKKLAPDQAFMLDKYKMYRSCGDHATALEALRVCFWLALKEKVKGFTEEDKPRIHKELRDRFEKEFLAVGSTYPEVIE